MFGFFPFGDIIILPIRPKPDSEHVATGRVVFMPEECPCPVLTDVGWPLKATMSQKVFTYFMLNYMQK